MDTISHALWGKALFGYRKHLYLPIFFGAIPDLIPFIPNLFFKLISGQFSFGRPSISSIPEWVFTLYDFSHSLITGVLIVIIFYLLGKKSLSFASLAWPFHILVDRYYPKFLDLVLEFDLVRDYFYSDMANIAMNGSGYQLSKFLLNSR